MKSNRKVRIKTTIFKCLLNVQFTIMQHASIMYYPNYKFPVPQSLFSLFEFHQIINL